MTLSRQMTAAAILLVAALSLTAVAQEAQKEKDPVKAFFEKLDTEYHGFYEVRGGYRLQNDPYQKDMSIMEARYQFDLFSMRDWGDIQLKGDVYGDLVTEEGVFDLREANVFTRPTDYMDVKFGRQILTWGTGDLFFINDLFPKDWQSFFIGRDTEYLKAPSDAVKVSFFHDWANLDVVYTPEFDADRLITGERISYWSTTLGSRAGRDATIGTDKPNSFFEDDEVALRLYRNIRSYELAFYGYWGFWKSPGGFNMATGKAIFPELSVYGMSLRGAVGKGIGNVEIGYYDSLEDRRGTDWSINNSEMRYLVGYSQEIAQDLTAGVQYNVEQMLSYGNYLASLPSGNPVRDEFRHVTSLRLTKLLMNQNLRLSLFTYYSPSDEDVYMRPIANYKASDNLAIEIGSNIFFGDEPHTFFGQFQNNTNAYLGVRYSF
jgi:hypothetical protein